MATSKSANTYNRLNWEDAEFPIVCQTCLGEIPYIRMVRTFPHDISKMQDSQNLKLLRWLEISWRSHTVSRYGKGEAQNE